MFQDTQAVIWLYDRMSMAANSIRIFSLLAWPLWRGQSRQRRMERTGAYFAGAGRPQWMPGSGRMPFRAVYGREICGPSVFLMLSALLRQAVNQQLCWRSCEGPAIEIRSGREFAARVLNGFIAGRPASCGRRKQD